MKIQAILAGLLLVITASANAGTTSSATGTVNATTAAQNAGNAQNINFNSQAQSDLRTVPNMAGNSYYGSFSQDGCMVSAGAGITVLGFGANGVTPYRDTQCDLRLSFQRIEQAAAMQPAARDKLHQAADDVLCALGGPVYQALKNQGICSESAVRQQEGDKKVATAATMQVAPAPKVAAVVTPAPVQAKQTIAAIAPVQQPAATTQAYVIDANGVHPVSDGRMANVNDPAIRARLGMK